ncbi:MAG: RsmE family RNA methyltransferase, partial [Candidatus Puniceispirillaceae bacterium]
LAAVPEDRLLVWCDEASATRGDRNAVSVFAAHPKPESAAILIGPEGGFSENERRILDRRENCLKVSLGPRILRADTAAIAALTCFQSVYGDWPGIT